MRAVEKSGITNQFPKLTLTAMYNVLEKLRANERIEGKDKETYDQGLIGILRDLHDQIDAAVAEAYGWPADLTDDQILHNLVALNRERATEEAQGLIRWLRPDFQHPAGQTAAAQGEQSTMDIGPTVSTDKAAWPKALPDQIARQFQRTRAASVQPLLESMSALGLAVNQPQAATARRGKAMHLDRYQRVRARRAQDADA